MKALWRAEGIGKRYAVRRGLVRRSVVALENVSLDLWPGEILGLVGESGGGKSTLARLALGLESPDAGRFFWKDEPYPGPERFKNLYRQIQCVFQSSAEACDPGWSGSRIIEEPLEHLVALEPGRRRERALELAASVGLPEACLDMLAGSLSGGQRQRLCLARALAVEPALLVLDEPTSSLDALSQDAALRLLRDISQSRNMAMLLISHDVRSILGVCRRIAVIRRGRILEVLAVDKLHLCADPYVRRLLERAV